MHCLGAQLDEALVVRDTGQLVVSRLAYTPDGGGLVALARAAPTPPSADEIAASQRLVTAYYRHPRSTINSTRNDILSFVAGIHHRYEPAEPDAAAWETLWCASPGKPERVAISQNGLAPPLAVSPSGNRLAMQAADGGIRIVDALKGRKEQVLEGHRGRLNTVAFSPDGSRLAALATHGSLALWDADDGTILLRNDNDHNALRFEFSPDSRRLAVVMRDEKQTREVRIHDAEDGRTLSSVHIPQGQGESDWLLAFSPDGSRMATSSNEHDLHVWDVGSGDSLAVLQGHTAMISALAFSPDGGQIVSGAANGNIRLWNAETFAFERELIGHDASVGAVAFRPDGETLASGSCDGTVRIWSSTATEPLTVLAGLRGMTAVAFSPDGRQLAVAPGGGGDVELWNPRTAERLCSLVGAGGTVAQLAYSPDGRLVAAAHETPREAGDIRVWKTDTGEQVQAFGDHGRGAVTVAFSPDGTRLLTTSGDEMLMAWDVQTGRRLMAILSRHQSMLFHRTGAVFGLAGSRVAYKQPQLFDGSTGRLVANLTPQGQVTALAASPDGRMLAAGMAIGNVYLTDFATGKRIAGLFGHVGSVRAIAFSPDNTTVVTGSQDGSVRLWDAATGNPIRVFVGHEGVVEQAMFSPDGRRIITAATDGTIRIWHPDLGQELCTLPGQRALPRAVALSPDGTRLVTAASGGSVRIWGLSNADITTARRDAAAAPEASVTLPQ
jgi:WD40 repeat protein